MSRTVRRKNQEQGDWWCARYRREFREDQLDPKRCKPLAVWLQASPNKDLYKVWLKKRYHSDKWVSYNKNPGWYNKLFERPTLRQDRRMKCRQILHLIDLEEYPLFLDKVYVPYYW